MNTKYQARLGRLITGSLIMGSLIIVNSGLVYAAPQNGKTEGGNISNSGSNLSGSTIRSKNENSGIDQKLEQKTVNYFLIQSADKASIEQDKKNPSIFIVTLKQLKPYISYFSDRPHRETGQLSIKEYLALWQKKGETSFQKIPPNAILQALNKTSSEAMAFYAMQLSNPQYDEKTGVLRYQAQSLSAKSSASNAGNSNSKNSNSNTNTTSSNNTQSNTGIERGDKFTPLSDKTQLEHVTVFIDDVCLSCW